MHPAWPEDAPISVATLSLFRFPTPLGRLWVIGQMALARRRGLWADRAQFVKLCGSGTGEGFTPRPNWQVWAIFAVWQDMARAQEQVDQHPVFRRWRTHASESWTQFLAPESARGSWSGVNPFLNAASSPIPPGAPHAVLTRATVKARHALAFWRKVPDISGVIGRDQNVLFKIGIGEVPLLHQVTYSVWPDLQTMAAFARHDGPHARAVRSVREGGWFVEELYARFRVLATSGTWGGQDPLADAMLSAAGPPGRRDAA